jgi:hypothetical protein
MMQVNKTLNADGLVLLAKEEMVLQGTFDMLWNGNECGRNLGNENFKATLLSSGYVRSNATGESGIF